MTFRDASPKSLRPGETLPLPVLVWVHLFPEGRQQSAALAGADPESRERILDLDATTERARVLGQQYEELRGKTSLPVAEKERLRGAGPRRVCCGSGLTSRVGGDTLRHMSTPRPPTLPLAELRRRYAALGTIEEVIGERTYLGRCGTFEGFLLYGSAFANDLRRPGYCDFALEKPPVPGLAELVLDAWPPG